LSILGKLSSTQTGSISTLGEEITWFGKGGKFSLLFIRLCMFEEAKLGNESFYTKNFKLGFHYFDILNFRVQ